MGVHFFSFRFRKFWNLCFQKWCQGPVRVSPAHGGTTRVKKCSYGKNCCGHFKPEILARGSWNPGLGYLINAIGHNLTKDDDCKLARTASFSTEQNLNVTLLFDIFPPRDDCGRWRSICLFWGTSKRPWRRSPQGLTLKGRKGPFPEAKVIAPFCANVVCHAMTMHTSWSLREVNGKYSYCQLWSFL